MAGSPHGWPGRLWMQTDWSGDCLLWTGSVDRGGYGDVYPPPGHRSSPAHRWAYQLARGPIPSGLHLDHLCHTWDPTCPGGVSCPHRRCVNPWHLEPVTKAENDRRGNSFSGTNFRKTHCIAGHPFDEANTLRNLAGHRACLACSRARNLSQLPAPALRTHCPQGHLYDAANTYVHGNKRNCRACGRLNQARYLARRRGSVLV